MTITSTSFKLKSSRNMMKNSFTRGTLSSRSSIDIRTVVLALERAFIVSASQIFAPKISVNPCGYDVVNSPYLFGLCGELTASIYREKKRESEFPTSYPAEVNSL